VTRPAHTFISTTQLEKWMKLVRNTAVCAFSALVLATGAVHAEGIGRRHAPSGKGVAPNAVTE
jgi:succinate dehydrogenase hydrophobic anchor subunit